MPPDPRPFRAFFGMPVRFSATEVAVLFSADWLDRPVLREQRRRAARQIEIAAAPYSEVVRRQVATRLGLAPLDAKEIANDLGISRRQLFRHLKNEGRTFRAVVDDFRYARARHLLSVGNAPLSQIAFALGFREQSIFTPTFARWAGIPPSEWRRINNDKRGTWPG
jgi:AraC-like DNA-binding protein